MKPIPKTPEQVHREIVASGLFARTTQEAVARAIGVNQGTISRIASGEFKTVNKSVIALCKYAKICTMHTKGTEGLLALAASAQAVKDPEKRKLVDIIRLAVALLERP